MKMTAVKKVDLETGKGAAAASAHLAKVAYALARESPGGAVILLATALGMAASLSGLTDDKAREIVDEALAQAAEYSRTILTEARSGYAQKH